MTTGESTFWGQLFFATEMASLNSTASIAHNAEPARCNPIVECFGIAHGEPRQDANIEHLLSY